MISLDTLPGGEGIWHEESMRWLSALGCSGDKAREIASAAPAFAPVTLKQVFTAVMDLGRRAGRLGETMALLGHQEAEFRRLREELGIPRAAPPSSLESAAVLVLTDEGWTAPGGWVPDILDRAAGHDVLNDSGAPPRSVSPSDLTGAGARHLFIIAPSDGQPEVDPDMVQVHRIRNADAWLRPGPGLPRAVFDAASRMHRISAVFSESPRS